MGYLRVSKIVVFGVFIYYITQIYLNNNAMFQIMKALITGGAGFIGFHLGKLLSEKGYDVHLLDNLVRGQEDDEMKSFLESNNVSFIKADLTKTDFFTELDSYYDQIYHLAAINGTENFYNIPHKVLKVGILGTLNMLDWFVESGKGKFLFSSSSEAYAGALKLLGNKFPIPTPEEVPLVIDDPKNVRWSYGGSKILSEIAVHSYTKAFRLNNISIIRYHNIYGPRMGYEHVIPQFIGRIANKKDPFEIFGGQETRTFCYVNDAIKATNLVMESASTNNKTIHIGRSDEEINILNLAKMLFDISGFHPNIDIKPAPEGCVMRRCPDVSKLSALGHVSNVSLKDGVIKTYEWYKNKFS